MIVSNVVGDGATSWAFGAEVLASPIRKEGGTPPHRLVVHLFFREDRGRGWPTQAFGKAAARSGQCFGAVYSHTGPQADEKCRSTLRVVTASRALRRFVSRARSTELALWEITPVKSR